MDSCAITLFLVHVVFLVDSGCQSIHVREAYCFDQGPRSVAALCGSVNGFSFDGIFGSESCQFYKSTFLQQREGERRVHVESRLCLLTRSPSSFSSRSPLIRHSSALL